MSAGASSRQLVFTVCIFHNQSITTEPRCALSLSHTPDTTLYCLDKQKKERKKGHYIYKNGSCGWGQASPSNAAAGESTQSITALDSHVSQKKTVSGHTLHSTFDLTNFESNNCPTRCDLFILLYFCRQLYMFQALTPIIRSSYSCNYSFWY